MRTAGRVLALLVGVALLVSCAVLIIEIVAQLADVDPVVFDWSATYRWAQRTTWDSAVVRAIAVLLIVVGLTLILVAVLPRRPVRLGVHSGDGATDAAITRRGLTHTLADAVSHVDGIDRVRVGVRRRRVTIKARRRQGLVVSPDQVAHVAQHRLAELELRRPPHLTVNMARSGR